MTIQPHDLSISTFRNPKAGAWASTPDNGVRIVHLPTGTIAECASFPSAHTNKAAAFDELLKKLEALPKPRIYWTYYPKSKRGYWRVSPMPKPYHKHADRWQHAHDYATKLNNKGVNEMAITITREALDEVRKLRLWHWQEAMTARKQAQNATDRAEALKADKTYSRQMQGMADLRNADADFHIRAVQTLNSFFDIGDTAEHDDNQNVSNTKSVVRDFIGMKKD